MGEHTAAVLEAAGIDGETIDELRDLDVV